MQKFDSIIEYKKILTNSFTNSYQTGMDLWSMDQGLSDIALLLLNHLDKKSAQRVLDIGTGNGRHAELYLTSGIRYTGIDIYTHSNWELYKSRSSDLVTFIQSSFLEWDTKESFTAVLDNGCFHHQHPEEYTCYLQKIYELLENGGYLMMGLYTVDDNDKEGCFHVMKSGKYRRYFTQKEIESLLNESGFTCLQQKKIVVKERNRSYLAVLSQKRRVIGE